MDTENGQWSPEGAAPLPPPPPPPPQPPGWADWSRDGGSWAYGSQTAMVAPPAPRRSRGLMVAAAVSAFALAAGGVALATSGSSNHALSTAAIATKTDAGLVDIMTTVGYQGETAAGTGMVLTASGEVLTNNHVIAGATTIKARDIGNGQIYTAKVVGYSDSQDVAVLQLEGASGLSTVSIGSSSGLLAGQPVVALGNAEGRGGTPAVATGQITGTSAEVTAEDQGSGALEHLTDMIRTDANIEPGDSGGPLLNSAGQVIGMDTAASTSNSGQAGTTAAVPTTAFAIPISRAISIADQIEAGTSSASVHIGPTAFLGVAVSSAQAAAGSASTGATIEGVVTGTPAARAGLAAGDTILSVGGHSVSSASDLQNVIERFRPSDRVRVTWTDQFGQTHSARVTLTSGPAG